MNWSNLSDFLAMGGYGLYVWGSFGVAALVMAGELVSLRTRRLALLQQHHDADGRANFNGATNEA